MTNRRDDVRLDLLASLVASVSILKTARELKKSPNMVVGSDKMFDEMISDYEKSIERARSVLRQERESK